MVWVLTQSVRDYKHFDPNFICWFFFINYLVETLSYQQCQIGLHSSWKNGKNTENPPNLLSY